MRPILRLLLPAAFAAAAGCMVWQPHWPEWEAGTAFRPDPLLLQEAHRACCLAEDEASLRAAISVYGAVLEAAPASYEALKHLSHLHLLLGDGHLERVSEKRKAFEAARRYAEAAMYTNPDFRKLADAGEPPWEAVRSLGEGEMEAMLFWVNAVFYAFKEGQPHLGQVINYRWVPRARRVMERMTEIDPDWGGGSVHFLWGVYYLSVPESVGGDRAKADAFFEKAVKAGPDRLLNRWGRAKYFHVKMGNPEGFREDLEWILSQPLERFSDHEAWKRFFVRDAERLLGETDRLFERRKEG